MRAGQSRLETHEGLWHSGRPYSGQWEQQNWSLEKAEEALEGYVAKRRVGRQGHISLYYRRIQLGREHAGAEAEVRYDRGSGMWVAQVPGGAARAVPAVEVDREKIITLTMYEEAKTKRRGDGP